MRFRLVGLLAVIATLVLGVQASEHKARAAGEARCARVDFRQHPLWVSSGAWSADGSVLFLADAKDRSITPYTPSGHVPDAASIWLSSVAGSHPSMLKTNSVTHNLVVEGEFGHRLTELDPEFAPLANHVAQVSTARAADKLHIWGVHQWEPVGPDIFAFTDVQGPTENNWWSSWVRYPIGDPQSFVKLHPFVTPDDSLRTFNRLGFPYVAAIGDTAYILSMERTPSLYKATANDTWLTALATASLPGFESTPALPPLHTYSDLAKVMAAVEQSTMPVGIYGWEGSLYVLARYPVADGKSSAWKLLILDPATGALLAPPKSLPLTASHVTVVPGSKYWAFVEKGPVKGFGVQDIASVFYVPAAQLRSAAMRSVGEKICSTD